MLLPLTLDRIPEALGRLIARGTSWDPVDKPVRLRITESGDPRLLGTTITGVIRDVGPAAGNRRAMALIELDRPIDYVGHYQSLGIQRLITQPYFRWHGLDRLVITSAHVRLIEGDNLQGIAHDRTIRACVNAP